MSDVKLAKIFTNTMAKELEKRGWSRGILAERSGVNLNTLQGYWKFLRIPRADDFLRIANTLDIDPNKLLFGDEALSSVNAVKRVDLAFLSLSKKEQALQLKHSLVELSRLLKEEETLSEE